MVAIFRYSPIDILSVRLPPSILEFNSKAEQAWTRKEAAEVLHENAFPRMKSFLFLYQML